MNIVYISQFFVAIFGLSCMTQIWCCMTSFPVPWSLGLDFFVNLGEKKNNNLPDLHGRRRLRRKLQKQNLQNLVHSSRLLFFTQTNMKHYIDRKCQWIYFFNVHIQNLHPLILLLDHPQGEIYWQTLEYETLKLEILKHCFDLIEAPESFIFDEILQKGPEILFMPCYLSVAEILHPLRYNVV